MFRLTIMLVLGLLSACSPYFVAPPQFVVIPFRAQEKGAVVEANLHIAWRVGYLFCLGLWFKDDHEDRDRVAILAGLYQHRAPSERPDLADRMDVLTRKYGHGYVPIAVRLTVNRVDHEHWSPVIDGQYIVRGLIGFTATYFMEPITSVRLEPGDYHVRVEALQDIPDLKNVPINFDAHVPP